MLSKGKRSHPVCLVKNKKYWVWRLGEERMSCGWTGCWQRLYRRNHLIGFIDSLLQNVMFSFSSYFLSLFRMDRHYQLFAVRTFNSFWVQGKFNSSLSPFKKQEAGEAGEAGELSSGGASTWGAQVLQASTRSSYPWYYSPDISWDGRFESGILPTFLERNSLAILGLHGGPRVDAVLMI